jgi:phage terminase large subunit GpA-like protein
MLASEVKQWVRGVLLGLYQPRPRETVWEWAERTLIIPSGGENVRMAGQAWSSRHSPYVREVMDWFRQPGKAELFIMKSSQTGMTMCLLIVICWHIVHRPANIGYIINSREEAKKISKGRLKPWILQNHILDRIGEAEDIDNMTYFLRGMMVHMMGACAEGEFRNKPLSVAILDDLDAHPPLKNVGTTADAARSRLKQDPNAKLCGLSKPNLESDQTFQEVQTGTMERYQVPCPHCDHYQPLIWKGIKFSGKEFEDLAGAPLLDVVMEKAYYECEFCQGRIEEKHKFDILQRGRWVATNPKALPNKRSMLLSDLYSTFVSWGTLAVEWIEAQKSLEKLTAFVQDRLGEPMKRQGGQLKDRDILRLRMKYERGTCPIRAVLCAISIDVQQASMKWAVLAYSKDGDMVVVEYGEALTWDEVDGVILREWASPFGPLFVQCGLVDEGDGHRAKEVREWTLQHETIFPVKGRGNRQVQGLISPSRSEVLGQEVLTYHVNDSAYKRELIFNRIKRAEKNDEYERGRLILPWALCESFVDELQNEVLEIKKDRFGFERSEWVKKGPNDYLDVCKYGLVIWDLNEPVLRAEGFLDVQAEVVGENLVQAGS